jgi:tRNA-modifying protein YgfZ
MMPDTTPVLAGDVLLFDRSARMRMHFTGPKAAESLTGLVTNDVLALLGGDGAYACALTAKGRIIADVRILAVGGESGSVESFLVDTNAAAGVGFAAMIRKYVNPRLARYSDITATTACLTLVGADALALIGRCARDAAPLEDIRTGSAYTHRELCLGDSAARVVRVPDLGESESFDIHCASGAADAVMVTLIAAGAQRATDDEWHRRRVIAGRAEWGIDMDESTLAQEANMDALQAISYKKGCYTGQETVARVHFRGHVNRTLRIVRYGDQVVPPAGVSLMTDDATTIGDARSSAIDDTGAMIGLAMLRREVSDGASLSWRDDSGSAHAVTVVGAADAD